MLDFILIAIDGTGSGSNVWDGVSSFRWTNKEILLIRECGPTEDCKVNWANIKINVNDTKAMNFILDKYYRLLYIQYYIYFLVLN